MSQLMRLWYLSHRQPVKAKVSLRLCSVSPEPSLSAHIKYGSRQRVWPKFRHLAPLDGCAYEFDEMSLRRMKSAIILWAGSYIFYEKTCSCLSEAAYIVWVNSHICYISHCEIKSHRIWPIWKPVPIRLSSLTEFSDILQHILRQNKHKSHFVVFIKISQNFIRSHLKICLTSQILVHSLWHVWTA